MIIDARTLPNDTILDAEVCIIGGGAAGLTIAHELSGKDWKVLLLESGGLDVDGQTQTLYAGTNIGLPYERLSTARSRYFGGSTNCWGGLCRPFESIDLESRAWVPNSGWPFGIEELEPHFERVHAILGIDHQTYETPYWQSRLRPEGCDVLPLDGTELENRIAQISRHPRLSPTSRTRLDEARNLTCCLNANVMELIANPAATVVERAACGTLSGVRFSVTARLFVLCCGGIENARLLLLSNRAQAAGLGNGHDLVGRYFTDHPRIKSTGVRLREQKRHRRLYDMTLCLSRMRLNASHLPVCAALAPTEDTQRRLGLLNSRTYLVARYHGEATAGFRALHDIRMLLSDRRKFGTTETDAGALLREAIPRIILHAPELAYALYDNLINPDWVKRTFTLETVLEPVPNPDSRVTLGPERDALGLNRPFVDWRLTAQDRDNYRRTHDLIRRAMSSRGLIIEGEPVEDPDAAWPDRITWCWHHMGTTRMHADPRHGVVDSRCRVHGVHNLYIGGSSVFPTMGSDHPTINLMALAFRLADELQAALRHSAVEVAGMRVA
jgi:choline dehydrogenase-like flavoprotein